MKIVIITPYSAWHEAVETPTQLHPKHLFSRRFEQLLTEVTTQPHQYILVDLSAVTASSRSSGAADRITQ
eukprot:5124332-Amphidinium_carterae.1